jgi:hypothetical protein
MDVCGVRRAGAYLGVVMLGLSVSPGCVSTGGKKAIPEQPLVAPASQVQSLWRGQIVATADVTHKGAQLPGLAGRVYLVGEDLKHTVKAKGKLLVDLYESDLAGPDGQPRLLEHYEFPEEVMNRLLRKDNVIGWGYTVFLPWPEYRPDIKRARLRICFMPENGTTLFAEPTLLTLHNDGGTRPVERVVPVSSQDVNQTGANIPMRVGVTNPPENR